MISLRQALGRAFAAILFMLAITTAHAQGFSGKPSANQVFAGPSSGPAAPGRFRGMVNGDLPVTTAPGKATVWPNLSQTSSAGSPWLAVDPWGNSINCAGTTTQCVNEALSAAATNGWPIEVDCTGKTASNTTPTQLFATSTIVIPPAFGIHVEFKECYINNTTSNPVILIDSQDSSEIYLQVFPNPGTNNDAVRIMPTSTNAALGNAKHILNSKIYVESTPSNGSGTGCLIDTTNGAIIGNDITCQDPNGGAYGIRLNISASTPFILEENKFRFRYVHAHTTAGVAALTATTNQNFCRKNQWYAGRISPASATDGFSTFCFNDTVIGLSVSNEEGTVTNGIHTQSGSQANVFIGGGVLGATNAKADAGIGNQWLYVQNVPNTTTTALLFPCSAAVAGWISGVSDSNVNTWGTGIGGGGGNIVLGFCDGTQWTVAGK
jgi:hypothetical protein